MASLMPSLFQVIADVNGKPIPNAMVWTYQAGTATPAATFTDATGLVSNANPVIADAYGRVSIWLPDSGAFKFIIQDQNGVPIDTIDNVTSPALSGAAVTALGNIKAASYYFPGSDAGALLGAAVVSGKTKAVRAPGTGFFTIATQQIVNFQATMWTEGGAVAQVSIYSTGAADTPIANSTIQGSDSDGAIAQNGAPITLPAGTYFIKGMSGDAVKQAWAVGYKITPV